MRELCQKFALEALPRVGLVSELPPAAIQLHDVNDSTIAYAQNPAGCVLLVCMAGEVLGECCSLIKDAVLMVDT